MISIREYLIPKRSYVYEDITSGTIYLEVKIYKKKWCVTLLTDNNIIVTKMAFSKSLINL